MITHRRICWPKPDATCLEGGCGYCDMAEFRAVSIIRRYAETAGVLPNRGLGEQDAMTAFRFGLEHDFFHAEVQRAESPPTK